MDAAARFFDEVTIGVGDEHHRLLGVVDHVAREEGLIVENQRDVILAGNVGGGDDGELVPGNARLEDDVADAAATGGIADGGSVKHAGKLEVVDVLGVAGDFRDTFFAENGSADRVLAHYKGGWLKPTLPPKGGATSGLTHKSIYLVFPAPSTNSANAPSTSSMRNFSDFRAATSASPISKRAAVMRSMVA